MFVVTEAQAAAIRTAYKQRGAFIQPDGTPLALVGWGEAQGA
jgi:hypothetical protein